MSRHLLRAAGASLALSCLVASLVALPVAAVPSAPQGTGAAQPQAVVTGTTCGTVSAFTAPTALTDGSVTLDGVAEPIAAGTTLDAGTTLALTTLASADGFTCLDLVVDSGGNITDASVAGSARVCGTASTDGTLYTVGDTTLTGDAADLIAADSDLAALLDAAASADADVCLDLTVDTGSGQVTAVDLDATLRICATAALDADSATLGGVDVPFSAISAEGEAALQLAADADVASCVNLTVEDTAITDATVDVEAELCGTVTVDGSGNATVNGVEIPAAMLDAGASAALEFAADADGLACATVVVDNDEAAVTADVQVCGTVTAGAGGAAEVGGAPVPEAVLSPELEAALDVAAAADAEVCLDVVAGVGTNLDATGTLDVCATVDAVSANSITIDGTVVPLAPGATVDVETGAEFGLRLELTEAGLATAVNVTVAGCADAPGAPAPTPDPDENVGGVGAGNDPDATLPPTSTISARDRSALGSSPAIAMALMGLASSGVLALAFAGRRRRR
jgi:hypothetical protein